MRTIFLAVLVASMPASASAQFVYVNDVWVQSFMRPQRDRLERFKSVRADAMQMTLAIDDESSQLTLENWADNRADLKPGASGIKLNAAYVAGKANTDSPKTDVAGQQAGAHVRVGAAEFEGSFIHNVFDDGTIPKSEYNKVGGGAGFAFGSEALSFGVHGNMNRSGNAEWKDVDNISSLGGGVVLRSNLYQLGGTVDYVSMGEKGASYDQSLKAPSFGVQAMIMPLKGLKAALRGSVAKFSGDAKENWVVNDEHKMDYKEMGARLEWKLDAVPLTVGLEFAKTISTPEELQAGLRYKYENNGELRAVGAGLRLLDGGLLLAAEVKEFIFRYTDILPAPDVSVTKLHTVTGGVELRVLPGFHVRSSVQRFYTSGLVSTTFAAGVGLTGEKMSLDVVGRRAKQERDAPETDIYTDIRVLLGMKF